MDTQSSIIPILFGVTLLVALAIGIYQFFRARKARQHHERSAMAEARHEAPTDKPPAGGGTTGSVPSASPGTTRGSSGPAR